MASTTTDLLPSLGKGGNTLAHDVWLVFGREMSHRTRQPTWLVLGLAQPLLFMFFFGPLLTEFVAHTPGFPPGDTWVIFVPSLMLQMVLVGTFPAGMTLLAEYRAGVLERFRVTPMHAAALVLGKVLCIAAYVVVQSSLIVLLAWWVFGLECSWTGLAASLLLVALLAVALASASYALALRLKNEDATAGALNAVTMPLLLLSGTLLPITEGLAPAWLYRLAQLNPVAHVMEATRAVFRDDFDPQTIGPGVTAAVVMSAAALAWGIRSFARLDA